MDLVSYKVAAQYPKFWKQSEVVGFQFFVNLCSKIVFNFFETSVCDYLLKNATFVFFEVSKIFKISKKIVKILEFCQSRGEPIVVGNHLGYGERKNT